MVVIAQGELVGQERNRHFKIPRGSKDFALRQPGNSRIVAALDEETGDMKFLPAQLAPIAVSLLPHIPKIQGRIFDISLQSRSLKTAQKEKTRQAGVNMQTVYESRGAKPGFRLKKTGGFRFKSTVAEIAREKRQKAYRARKQIFYQDHP
jgi:hypothetical protein